MALSIKSISTQPWCYFHQQHLGNPLRFPNLNIDCNIVFVCAGGKTIRWNGLPGTVARGAIEVSAVEDAKKILWAREPKTTVMAAVPAAWGGGRIVFSQLDLQRRVDRTQRVYDPAAERVLLSLLDRGS